VAGGRKGKPAKGSGGASKPPEGLSQEDAANRVPCAQATVSKFARRGWLTQLSNGRLAECAVQEVRDRLAANEQDEEETGDWKKRAEAATARLREAQASLRELQLEVESGRFVERAAVERSSADAAQRILSVLRAMPQRIAREVEAALAAPFGRRAAAAEKIIAAEVERAVEELNRTLTEQAEKPPAPPPAQVAAAEAP
jgi:phage terminase Nu1 subunit (DNA packaging protein)